jgi:DNA modification methylase
LHELPNESVDLMVTSPPYPMIEMWDEIFSKQNSAITDALAKENGNITNSNNNTSNCNNKIFNLQVYLNETCKDAINLTEFVDSIKVQIKDLEKVGEKGYSAKQREQAEKNKVKV